jgi:secondary thiamine-phosphate synthase enzyme
MGAKSFQLQIHHSREEHMQWLKDSIQLSTSGKGLHEITDQVAQKLQEWNVHEGMCFLFIQHTSASLVLSENFDPSAQADLETFMNRLVPEGQHWYRHTMEGADDSPSHIRAMITTTSASIPVDNGELNLGTWQGIYIFEHRERPQRRNVLLRCMQVS